MEKIWSYLMEKYGIDEKHPEIFERKCVLKASPVEDGPDGEAWCFIHSEPVVLNGKLVGIKLTKETEHELKGLGKLKDISEEFLMLEPLSNHRKAVFIG